MRNQSVLDRFAQGAQERTERLLRAAAGGQFLHEPPEPAPSAPGYRSETTGQFVGYGVDEHQATRSQQTGRIKDLGPAEAVPRSTLSARYGPPDGARSLREKERERIEDREVIAGASAADVSLAPDEARRGVGSGGRASTTATNVPYTDNTARFDATPEEEAQDIDRIDATMERDDDPFELQPSAADADLFTDEEQGALSDEFGRAADSFEEISRDDRETFFDTAAEIKRPFADVGLDDGINADGLAVDTTNTLLDRRR